MYAIGMSNYRIEKIQGGVAVYWHSAPNRISNAIRIFATTTEARAWVATKEN